MQLNPTEPKQPPAEHAAKSHEALDNQLQQAIRVENLSSTL